MGASRLGFAVVTALALGGCFGSSDDDDDEGESCGAVQACGGDVVGTWNFVDMCVTGGPTSVNEFPECEGSIALGAVDATGQVELTADGQTVTSLNLTMHVTYTLTEACLSAQAGAPIMVDQAACDAGEASLSGQPDVSSASCTLSNDACVCAATLQTSGGGQGTYMTSGTNFVDADGTITPYCVSGDTLILGGETDFGMVTYVLQRVTR
jgi:hypothetical protein